MPSRKPIRANISITRNPAPSETPRSPIAGHTTSWDSTAATSRESPKHSARVASTVATTNAVSAESEPTTTEGRAGPWVNTVFQVPQP